MIFLILELFTTFRNHQMTNRFHLCILTNQKPPIEISEQNKRFRTTTETEFFCLSFQHFSLRINDRFQVSHMGKILIEILWIYQQIFFLLIIDCISCFLTLTLFDSTWKKLQQTEIEEFSLATETESFTYWNKHQRLMKNLKSI